MNTRRRNALRLREELREFSGVHTRSESTQMTRRNREAEAQLRSRPVDTRGLTARLMGDPLPGLSALDQRRNNHE